MSRVQQRIQATILSAALAIGGVLPATAAAQEPDQDHEGTVAPEPTAPPDSTANPDFDPGARTDLPFSVDLRAGGGDDDSGDGAPVDSEPVSDPDTPALQDDPAVEEPQALGDETPGPPAETAPPPSPVDEAPAPAPPATATPTPPAPEAEPPLDRRAKRSAERAQKRDHTRRQPAPFRVTLPVSAVPAPAPLAAPVPAPAPVAAETDPVPAAEARSLAQSGAASHTVRRGESLWTIASARLGPRATDAEIDAESDRIYNLNRDRIGPDPNQLIAGTVLRLR